MRCSNCSEKVHPLVAIDIDGTLGDYHGHFISFAEAYLGSKLPRSYTGEQEFSVFLGLPKPLYREIKLAYRQGGMKRSMPIYPYAPDFVTGLRKKGIEIWITTTRPYLRLDNIDPDTRHWLKRHEIDYDGLLFNEDKYERLVEIVDKERILAVVDDQPSRLDSASSLGLTTFLRVTNWNLSGWSSRHHATDRYDTLTEWITERLDAWNRENGGSDA